LLRPGNDVPFPTDHTPPTLHIARVIRHHVVLAPMLTQTGHDLAAHAPTVDDHTNFVIRHTPHVVPLRRIPHEQALLPPLTIPPLED
jgi:hypothetical protein